MDKIKVGIIGATGYGGVELVRLLHNHPLVQLVAVSSVSFEGREISNVYGNLYGIVDKVLTCEDKVVECSDVVFSALPHGLSEKIAIKCSAAKVVLIDLGADFRLEDESDYKQWYNLDFLDKSIHANSVYCIPELHRASVMSDTSIIANPGCYPTSAALALAPLAKNNILNPKGIIIDSKSGVTGAGRSLSEGTHYPEVNGNFSAYKIACHRHTPEIEQCITKLCGEKALITFVPHLLPVNRGILSTVYAEANVQSAKQLHDIYTKFYKNEKFVRVLGLGSQACIKNVLFSNYCDISVHYDDRCGKVIIVSCIDNMVKGAAGQAIQNMNIIFGIDECTGLDIIPPAF